MQDDDLTRLINERRRRQECEAAGIPYVPDVLASRPPPHCDPALPETVSDVLLDPNPAPEITTPDAVLPPPLKIYSPYRRADCIPGSVGFSESDAGAIELYLYLDDVAAITRSELYRLTPFHADLQAILDGYLAATDDHVDLDELGVPVVPDPRLSPRPGATLSAAAFNAMIVAATGVELTAAAGIRQSALDIRANLHSLAGLVALGRLVCKFYNDAIWVVCDGDDPKGYVVLPTEPVPLPDNTAYQFRAGGEFESLESAEAATRAALLSALSDLDCVYQNTVQTVTCADEDAAFAYDYAPAFLWNDSAYDTLEALGSVSVIHSELLTTTGPGFHSFSLDSLIVENQLVYTVTVLPSPSFAAATQEAADEKAYQAALQALNCFFPSRRLEVDCTAVEAVANAIALGSSRESVFAAMDEEFVSLASVVTDSGNPVAVTNQGLIVNAVPVEVDDSTGLIAESPAGIVASRSSQEEADAEAESRALSFLSCVWRSPKVTCSCTDWLRVGASPDSYIWSENDPNFIALKAPLSRSSSSDAMTFEKGELGISESAPVTDAMALCLSSLTCVYCNEIIEPVCSIVYTELGFEANLYEPGVTLLPLALVSSTETTLPTTSLDLTAGLPAGSVCDGDPRLVLQFAEGQASLPPRVNNEAGVPRCRYTNAEVTITCQQIAGDMAFGLASYSKELTVTVSAGSFEASDQAIADDLAEQFARVSLTCFYVNPRLTLLCGAEEPAGPVAPEFYNDESDGMRIGTDPDRVSAESFGSPVNPVVVDKEEFASLLSPTDAMLLAFKSGRSQLDCFWQSARVDARCDSPTAMPPEFANYYEDANIRVGYATRQVYIDSDEPVGIDREGLVGVLPAPGGGGDPMEPPPVIPPPGELGVPPGDLSFRDGGGLEPDTRTFYSRVWLVQSRPPGPGYVAGSDVGIHDAYKENFLERFSPDSLGNDWGEVFVEAKTAVSRLSQAAANKQAYAMAVAQLDCFFESARVDLRCTAPKSMPSGWGTEPEEGNIWEGDNRITHGHEQHPGDHTDIYATSSTGYYWLQAVADARMFTSRVGQYEINRLAYNVALRQLDCFYLSAEINMLCTAPQKMEKWSGANEWVNVFAPDSGDQIPTDCPAADGSGTSPWYSPDSIGDVWGEVKIERQAALSYASQDAANIQAYNTLWPSLDCFWQNPKVDLRCTAPNGMPAKWDKEEWDGHIEEGGVSVPHGGHSDIYADVSTGFEPGQVYTDAKAFVSYKSQKAVNLEAYRAAWLQLDCFYLSCRVELLCTAPTPAQKRVIGMPEGEWEVCYEPAGHPGVPVVTPSPDGDTAWYGPDSNGDAWGEVQLDRAAVISYKSQDDANLTAYAMIWTTLDCFWQSAQIELQCDSPPAILEPERHAWWDATIKYGNNDRLFSEDSVGDTPGEVETDRKTITSYRSQYSANKKAYDLTYPQLDCFWQSARIELMCGADKLTNSETPDTGLISSGNNAENYAADSNGALPGQVFGAAKLMRGKISQLMVNQLAYVAVYSLLDCFWQSAKIDLKCGADRTTISNADEEDTIISGGVDVTWSDASEGWPESVITEAKAASSYDSQVFANQLAYTITLSQLECFYGNDLMVISCPYGTTGDDVTIAADTVMDYFSKANANMLARLMGESQLECEGAFSNAATYSSKCPGDELPEAERRWELEASGVVDVGTVFADDQETADQLAGTLAELRTICKPIKRCNSTIISGAQPAPCCGAVPTPSPCHGTATVKDYYADEVCFYGFLQTEVDAMTQTMADAQSFCLPDEYYNTAVTATKDCESEGGVCALGSVAAGAIPSWTSVADADAIALGIANALTVCCDNGGSSTGGWTPPDGAAAGDLLQWNGADWIACGMTPAAGNMMYFDGTTWETIPSAGGSSPTVRVLTQAGTAAPTWQTLTPFNVDLCNGGTATTYTLYGLP